MPGPMSAHAAHAASIDQWVDTGDHTVTVDPVRNEAWIRPGIEDRHVMTKARGLELRAKNTLHIANLLDNAPEHNLRIYTPDAATLQKMPAFQSGNAKMGTYRGQLRDVRGAGELPVITAKIYDGTLDNMNSVGKGDIEREGYETRHAISNRVFEQSGAPDHGLPKQETFQIYDKDE